MIIYKIFIIIIIFIVIFLALSCLEISTNINFHEVFNPKLYELPNISNIQTTQNIQNIPVNNELTVYGEFNPNIINQGKNLAKQSKIVICSLARNNSDKFEKSKIRLEYIGKQFAEYKIIIFENDSEDNTRELMSNWTKQNNNVILLKCCHLNNCDCKLKFKKGYDYGSLSMDRFSRMALYREQYLNYIKKNLYYYDYMLVVDFDLDGNVNINGLYDSIMKDDWSAIFCNGRISLPGTFGLKTFPYDGIAILFMEDDFKNIKYTLFDCPYKCFKMDYYSSNTHFLQVKSAFNGYGLYKIKDILNCSYMGDNNVCEHLNLSKCLFKNNKKLFINFYWTGYFNRQGNHPIRFLYELL